MTTIQNTLPDPRNRQLGRHQLQEKEFDAVT